MFFRDGRSGMLKLSIFNNMRTLPFDESTCRGAADCKASFVAGDIRANLFIGLSSMHTLFAREHNRLVYCVPTDFNLLILEWPNSFSNLTPDGAVIEFSRRQEKLLAQRFRSFCTTNFCQKFWVTQWNASLVDVRSIFFTNQAF